MYAISWVAIAQALYAPYLSWIIPFFMGFLIGLIFLHPIERILRVYYKDKGCIMYVYNRNNDIDNGFWLWVWYIDIWINHVNLFES